MSATYTPTPVLVPKPVPARYSVVPPQFKLQPGQTLPTRIKPSSSPHSQFQSQSQSQPSPSSSSSSTSVGDKVKKALNKALGLKKKRGGPENSDERQRVRFEDRMAELAGKRRALEEIEEQERVKRIDC